MIKSFVSEVSAATLTETATSEISFKVTVDPFISNEFVALEVATPFTSKIASVA